MNEGVGNKIILNNSKKISFGIVNNLINVYLFVIFAKIIYEFSFFTSNGKISLGITALLSLLCMSGVVYVFRYLTFKTKALWIGFIFFVMLSYVFHFVGLEYICNTLTFLGILTLLPYSRFRFSQIKIIMGIFGAYVILLFLFASKFEGGKNLIDINTNTSGIIMCLFQIMLFAFLQLYGKQAVARFLCYIFLLVSFLFQLEFASRSSLLGTAVLLTFVLFKKVAIKFNNKTFTRFILFLAVFSIVFAYVYSVTLFNAIGHGKIFILGKDIFTGRQRIWSEVFERLRGHWLFGVGNTDVANMTVHNQMLGYLFCYGIFVLLGFIALLNDLIKKLVCRHSKFLVVSIMVFLLISFFETLIYSSYNIAFTTLCMIVAFSCDRIYSERKEKKNE